MRLLKEFVRDPVGIGTVLPSSRYLAREMTSEIGLERAETVVEIGPGSGVFTSQILKMITSKAKFFVVELNPRIHEHLSEKYPNVKIYNESAENLPELIKKEKMNSVDVVVSSLPWVSFPPELQDKLMDAIYKTMTKGGRFSTYGYIHGKIMPRGHSIKKLLKSKFHTVDTSEIVWQNLPPAFVYKCKK
ncbi:MAG TPA: methyltransferase [Lentisphaeria bacterium]|nr:MAG: hypothetical protein A2X45_22660 [Lentisphaerae bacterium GWF2_50_93]HCE45099.1 methyltransferase [Lentisphaeria bacterium]